MRSPAGQSVGSCCPFARIAPEAGVGELEGGLDDESGLGEGWDSLGDAFVHAANTTNVPATHRAAPRIGLMDRA
jgi:hypothetical protein